GARSFAFGDRHLVFVYWPSSYKTRRCQDKCFYTLRPEGRKAVEAEVFGPDRGPTRRPGQPDRAHETKTTHRRVEAKPRQGGEWGVDGHERERTAPGPALGIASAAAQPRDGRGVGFSAASQPPDYRAGRRPVAGPG